MIRDFCFESSEEIYSEINGESSTRTANYTLLSGDLDGDGKQETILCSLNGAVTVLKVS